MAYAKEARSAYTTGSLEYGEIARSIAFGAYAAAVRLACRLLTQPDSELLKRIEHLEGELAGISANLQQHPLIKQKPGYRL